MIKKRLIMKVNLSNPTGDSGRMVYTLRPPDRRTPRSWTPRPHLTQAVPQMRHRIRTQVPRPRPNLVRSKVRSGTVQDRGRVKYSGNRRADTRPPPGGDCHESPKSVHCRHFRQPRAGRPSLRRNKTQWTFQHRPFWVGGKEE